MNNMMDNFWNVDRDLYKSKSFYNYQQSVSCNIDTDDNHYSITMEVPGFAKKDIKIIYQNSYLMISGRININSHTRNDSKETSQSRVRQFAQSIQIPLDANIKEIESFLDKGILTIVVPRIIDKEFQEKLADIGKRRKYRGYVQIS